MPSVFGFTGAHRDSETAGLQGQSLPPSRSAHPWQGDPRAPGLHLLRPEAGAARPTALTVLGSVVTGFWHPQPNRHAALPGARAQGGRQGPEGGRGQSTQKPAGREAHRPGLCPVHPPRAPHRASRNARPREPIEAQRGPGLSPAAPSSPTGHSGDVNLPANRSLGELMTTTSTAEKPSSRKRRKLLPELLNESHYLHRFGVATTLPRLSGL